MKSVLVTGGTGSFGKKFVEMLLRKHPDIDRVVVYSRDELKQFEMAQHYPSGKYPSLRFFIGDVRDGDRLRLAMEGVDTVCLLYTSPSPRDLSTSRMPSSA